jgi:hypothetical protein
MVMTEQMEQIDQLNQMITQQMQQNPTAKITNIMMPNQQQAVMQYTNEAFIPRELQELKPLQTMIIMKRSLGNEKTYLDQWILNAEYNLIGMLQSSGFPNTALDIALSVVNEREGLRAFDGFDRRLQAIQYTISEEKLTTSNEVKKPGFFSKITGFAKKPEKQ